MKLSLYLSFLFLPLTTFCQTDYFTIASQILQDEREIKLQLPRNYVANEDQSYPLIFVFDGDYLFEPVAGIVDYLSYWDEVPESIVIGINQSETRNNDFQIGSQQYLPTGKGADFFDFIETELIPVLEDKYRISGFKVAVGHNRSANFINFFLLRDTLLFNGYIALSPLLSTEMSSRVEGALKTKDSKLFYQLSYAEEDFPSVKQKLKPLGESIQKISNSNLEFSLNKIKGATHFTMVSRCIPIAIEQIFSVYRPITPKVYEEQLLKSDDIIGFLEEKYIKIEQLYALEVPMSINDLMFAAKAIKKKEKWDAMKDLAKLAEKNHPNKILGNYYLALHFEKIGKPKKAIKYYEAAYSFEPVEKITKNLVLEKADELKELFGY